MRVELKDFQKGAVASLYGRLSQMREAYERMGTLSSVCLSSVTGSGKTVMCAAVIEALFFGSDEMGLAPDEHACVLWVSDSPSLNAQTHARFAGCSDKLANWLGDNRCLEDVTNNFCASHEVMEPRHVYFLSKDLLGRGNKLVKGGEDNSGRVFWDVLDRTIKDPGVNLYLFIDEAHRGFGMNRGREKATDTIYGQIVNGLDGRAPVPMVVGVSATPERFEARMSATGNRDLKPRVHVPPTAVQESGLVKDTIELRVPDDDDPVEHQYLTMASERFRTAWERWDAYCDAQREPRVFPLMIVQVKDGVQQQELRELCEQISGIVPGLSQAASFANVFGDHKDLSAGPYLIPYVAPELVQETRHVQILFAKEAISNGWDCPRAEVIFSQRPRKDPTYIAQLIGRMVRTPLARRIDADVTLNSIACYLPQFNPEATQGVVDYLTGKTDEMGGVGRPTVVVEPVTVRAAAPRTQEDYAAEFERYQKAEEARVARVAAIAAADEERHRFESGYQPELAEGAIEPPTAPNDTQSTASHTDGENTPALTLDADPLTALAPMAPPEPLTARDESFTPDEWAGIRAAFDSIPVKRAPRKARNEFTALLNTATLFMETGIDADAGEKVNEDFARKLAGDLIVHEDEVAAAREDIENTNTRVIRIDKLRGGEVTETGETVVVDDEGIKKAARDAIVAFGGRELVNAYRRRLLSEGVRGREADLRLASAAKSPSVVASMQAWAKCMRSDMFDAAAGEYDMLREQDRQRYRELESETASRLTTELAWPDVVNIPNKGKRYPRHIIQDEDGLCPLDLNDYEDAVVKRELARDRTVAFYRNPSNNSPQVFSFPYSAANGIQSCRPDFIFFVRDADGDIRPSIIDPHGTYLADTIPKLKGYVAYLREFPDVFVQVRFIGVLESGECRSLNLLRREVQEAILNFSGDESAELLADERYSNRYE